MSIVFSEEEGSERQPTANTEPTDSPADESVQTPPISDPSEPSVPSEPTEFSDERIGVSAPDDKPMVRFPTAGDRPNVSGSSTAASGRASGNVSGQTVGFGELRGRGRRFVYVIDRSKSMRWPDELPMRYALSEARSSIESLDPKKGALKFQLILYNHDARAFGTGRLLDVTPANQHAVAAYLDAVQADGGTDPLTALEMAIQLKPDVIFFLTDADEEIQPMVLARIREARIRSRVDQIHVMEFGQADAKRRYSYKKLAEQNNGIHIFKDILSL